MCAGTIYRFNSRYLGLLYHTISNNNIEYFASCVRRHFGDGGENGNNKLNRNAYKNEKYEKTIHTIILYDRNDDDDDDDHY